MASYTLLALLIGLVTMLAGVLVQAATFAWMIRFLRRAVLGGHTGVSFLRDLAVVSAAMLIVVAGNLLLASVWALVFLAVGELESFDIALYHSAVNITTLGYGDIVVSERWRLLGPLEAMNGVITIGMSTAALYAVVSKLFQDRQGDVRQDQNQ